MAEKVEDTITDHQKHRIGIISATTPHHMDISYNSDYIHILRLWYTYKCKINKLVKG